jgi:hypothetical protein
LLKGWESPGARTLGGSTVEHAYVFGTQLLGDRSFVLDKFKLLNILKFPFCVGVQKQIVLARLGEQLTPPFERPFESEWDFVSWIESHDPELAESAKRPPQGPSRLNPHRPASPRVPVK